MEKKGIRLKEITFHGHKVTSNGVKAENGKVKAIVDMPRPNYVSGVQRFCGMVQYMTKIIPSLSTTLQSLGKLTNKDIYWKWNEECKKAFTYIKKQLTCTPIFAY